MRSFDQGTTETSFRSSSYPTLAADGTRIYLAWSGRGYASARLDPVTGDARIVLTTSVDGRTWTAPRKVDDPDRPGHQIMPALTFGGGKLVLLYYDLREDVSGLFGPYVDEYPIVSQTPPANSRRHTIDVRVAQVEPGERPEFTSVQLSDYPFGVVEPAADRRQLQFNPPNLTLFRKGTVPFLGDYLDVALFPTIRPNEDGTWSFNIEPSTGVAGTGVWTDNRDVRAGNGGNLVDYTPSNSPARRGTSLFDPTQTVPACVPDQTGTRDQNIYSARFDEGLFAGALGNSKPLNGVQRASSRTRRPRCGAIG